MFSNRGFPKHKTRCKIVLEGIDKDFLIQELKQYYGERQITVSLLNRLEDTSYVHCIYTDIDPKNIAWGYDSRNSFVEIPDENRYFDISDRFKKLSKSKKILKRINSVRIS